MTIRDMIDYIQADVDSPRYCNDERLINLINAVHNRMCNSLKLVIRDFYKFESTADEQRYLMPSNYIAVEYLWYDNGGMQGSITLRQSPREIYGKHSDPDTDTSDTPYTGFIWESSGRRELWVYPLFATDGVDIWMWFYGTPARLTTENDVPVMPAEMHIYLVEACINRCRRIDEQITITEELALYKDLVGECRSMDTTKAVMSDNAKVAKNGTYLSEYNNFGLVDGSEQGIQWEE